MLIWIGKEKGQEGIPGIPGRDLTDEEVKRYGGKTWLVELGLWKEPEPEPEPKKEKKSSSRSSD